MLHLLQKGFENFKKYEKRKRKERKEEKKEGRKRKKDQHEETRFLKEERILIALGKNDMAVYIYRRKDQV